MIRIGTKFYCTQKLLWITNLPKYLARQGKRTAVSFFLSDYNSINVSPNAPHSAKILSAKTCILLTNVTYFRMRKAQNLENKDKGISVEVFCGVFCYGYAVGKFSWAMLLKTQLRSRGTMRSCQWKVKRVPMIFHSTDDTWLNRKYTPQGNCWWL